MRNWSEYSVALCRISEAGWDEIGRGCLIRVVVVECCCESKGGDPKEGHGGGSGSSVADCRATVMRLETRSKGFWRDKSTTGLDGLASADFGNRTLAVTRISIDQLFPEHHKKCGEIRSYESCIK